MKHGCHAQSNSATVVLRIQLVFILFILHKITSSDALCPCTLNSDEEKDNKGEKTSLILT